MDWPKNKPQPLVLKANSTTTSANDTEISSVFMNV
jgi:hypothetical protein